MSTPDDLSSLTREELADKFGVEMAKKDEMVAAAQAVKAQRDAEAQQREAQRQADQAALANTDLNKSALQSAARDLGVTGVQGTPVPELAQAIVEAVQPVVTPPMPPMFDNNIPSADPTADFPPQPPAGQLPPRR